jgi:phage N-6-adenine-methyltransferase
VAEPKHNKGKSKQDYETPQVFIDAVCRKLEIAEFMLDVAATAENAKAPFFYGVEQDGLAQSWRAPGTDAGWTWCNPPYADIRPWVEKAYAERAVGNASALLLPAGVGANWWRDWVHEKVHVLFLNGRLTFVGADQPYPKDCALLVYSRDYAPGYHVWTWRDTPGLTPV